MVGTIDPEALVSNKQKSSGSTVELDLASRRTRKIGDCEGKVDYRIGCCLKKVGTEVS